MGCGLGPRIATETAKEGRAAPVPPSLMFFETFVYGTAGNPVVLHASDPLDVGAPAEVGHVMSELLAP